MTRSANLAAGETPVVSVLVLTYNHECWIEGALRSVLSQAVSFPIEILVADDCSTDGTGTVLRRLLDEHPGRFVLLPREKNLGLSQNLEEGLRACRGRYVALLEGDDAWIDPRKLERVVAALEAHPKWSGCFHACRVEFVDGARRSETLPQSPLPSEVTLADLLRTNCVPSYSTVTYRAGLVMEFPPWHRGQTNGDWALHCFHAAHGPLGFLPQVMTAYRVHARGMWSGKPIGDRWNDCMRFWSNIDAHFGGQYHDQIEAGRREFLDAINREYADLKRIERRYHRLGLDRLAGLLQRVKRLLGGG